MEPAKDDKGREDKAARAAKDKSGEVIAPGHPAYYGNMVDHAMKDGRTEGRIEAASSGRALFPVVIGEDGVVRMQMPEQSPQGENKGETQPGA